MKSKLKIDRRTVLTGVAALGTVTFLPYAARAASNRVNSVPTVSGEIEVPPRFPRFIRNENTKRRRLQ